jgi:predicted RNA-binding Zn ribbon-like protein
MVFLTCQVCSRGYNGVMALVRPHKGEPLALDLLNTYWRDAEGSYDLLSSKGDTESWLAELEFNKEPASEKVLQHLTATRDTIRHVLQDRNNMKHLASLNQILLKGHRVESLGPTGPQITFQTQKDWYVAWRAAYNLLELLQTPERVKKCAHPDCVLYFYDTSPKNARSWHDMKTCGNRAKAARHYERSKQAT